MSNDQENIREMSIDEFAETYRPLVNGVVSDLWSTCREELSLGDMRSCAFEGLLHARRTYDSDESTEFSTYAYPRIRGAILDGSRRARWSPRNCRVECRDDLGANHLREAVGELEPAEPPASESDAPMCVMLMEPSELQRLHLSSGGLEQDRVARDELHSLLVDAMEKLGKIERAIVRLHDLEGRTLRDVAEEFGCSVSWAGRLRERAIDQLREVIFEEFSLELPTRTGDRRAA